MLTRCGHILIQCPNPPQTNMLISSRCQTFHLSSLRHELLTTLLFVSATLFNCLGNYSSHESLRWWKKWWLWVQPRKYWLYSWHEKGLVHLSRMFAIRMRSKNGCWPPGTLTLILAQLLPWLSSSMCLVRQSMVWLMGPFCHVRLIMFGQW